MAWVSVGTAAASAIVGGVVSADASRRAANTQADSARAAAAQNQQDMQPWLDAGKQGLQTLQTGLQPGGQFNKPFTMADATNSPAEQEALRRSSEATQNSAAARGGLIGSNVMDQLQVNAGKIAAGFEGQAFDQWNTQQNRQLGANQSLAQVGQTSATNVGNSNADAILAAGGAQAGYQMGQGSATTGAIGQIGNILGQNIGNIKDYFQPTSSPYTAPDANGVYANPTTGASGMGVDPTYLGGAASAGDFSDERLKTNIEKVGQTDGGLPIYTYNMRGGGPKKMGVMAQDVEKVNPRAVMRHPSGFRMVDYGRVS